MVDNYAKIVQDNLAKLYQDLPQDLEKKLPGQRDGDRFTFKAFGENCEIAPDGVRTGAGEHASVLGILLTLYAQNACSDACVTVPFKAFKQFPSSMPYVGAFATHTELVLAPHVQPMKNKMDTILDKLDGEASPAGTGGDFSFVVYPLPKIALCYILYEEDDEFPATATCLFSANAHLFLPIDGLADVGEYTSKKIIELIG